MNLRFMVRYQTLTMLDTGMEPRQGSAEYLKLQFTFVSKDWASLRKTLYISSEKYSEPFVLESNEFEVPTYYTQQSSFTITLLGDNEGMLVPTNELIVSLSPSNNLWTAQPPDPQNSAYVQLLNSLGDLTQLNTKDKSTIVAAINEVVLGSGTAPSTGDYISNPDRAAVGQTIVVAEVDASGKPTKWKASDFPKGDSVSSAWVKCKEIVTTEETWGVTVDMSDGGVLPSFSEIKMHITFPDTSGGTSLIIQFNSNSSLIFKATYTNAIEASKQTRFYGHASNDGSFVSGYVNNDWDFIPLKARMYAPFDAGSVKSIVVNPTAQKLAVGVLIEIWGR